jgi:hypothetical protein
MVLANLKPEKTFDSWGEVLSFLQELETEYFFPLCFHFHEGVSFDIN